MHDTGRVVVYRNIRNSLLTIIIISSCSRCYCATATGTAAAGGGGGGGTTTTAAAASASEVGSLVIWVLPAISGVLKECRSCESLVGDDSLK
jgi:hypothetical protein